MDISYEGTQIIVCVYVFFNMLLYVLLSLYGGSHASDILHVLMGVSVV